MDYISYLGGRLYNIVAPGPTTPMFQPGGLMEDYNEDLVQIFGSVFLFAVIDMLIIKPFMVQKARYFVLHFIANMWVCAVTLPTVIRCFTEDPMKAFIGPGEIIANNIVAGLHLYHCIGFNLSADDIFHHLTFCFTLCSVAIPLKWANGAASPFASFFLSGLPGGIDYFVLTLQTYGYVSKDFQKSLYTKLNVWVRGPGACVYSYLCWITRLRVEVPYTIWVSVFTTILTYYNGQFYTQQAIESNAIYRYKKKLERMGVVIPESRKRSGSSSRREKSEKKQQQQKQQ